MFKTIEEIFEANENEEYPTGLSMSSYLFNEEEFNPIQEFLSKINALDLAQHEPHPEDDWCMLKYSKYPYSVKVVLIPLGSADTFIAKIKRI